MTRTGDEFDGVQQMLPDLLATVGPMALTAAWLEALEHRSPAGPRETGHDIITPLVTELITFEVLSEPNAA